MGGFVRIDEGENLLRVAGEDDTGCFDAVEGESKIMEIAVGDGVAEKRGCGFPVRIRQVQDDTNSGVLLFAAEHEVVYDGVVLGLDTGADNGMAEEGIHLLIGEVPDTVDLFALKNILCKIAAKCTVGEAGELCQVAEGVVVAGGMVFYGFAPFVWRTL